jgi:hypothetical protein
MPDTALGFTYPASTDPPRGWEQIQTLAADLDAYLTARFAELAANAVSDATNLAAATSTTIAAGSPILGLAFTAPTSGKVWVATNGAIEVTSGTGGYHGPCVRTGAVVGSGSNVLDPSAEPAARFGVHNDAGAGWGTAGQVLGGLTPGASYNVFWVHWLSTAGSLAVLCRRVDFIPLF